MKFSNELLNTQSEIELNSTNNLSTAVTIHIDAEEERDPQAPPPHGNNEAVSSSKPPLLSANINSADGGCVIVRSTHSLDTMDPRLLTSASAYIQHEAQNQTDNDLLRTGHALIISSPDQDLGHYATVSFATKQPIGGKSGGPSAQALADFAKQVALGLKTGQVPSLPSDSASDVDGENSLLTTNSSTLLANLALDDNPYTLMWHNVTVLNGEKLLLKNSSGVVAGGLWAVMGPSGGGKTVLLNTLTYRSDRSTTIHEESKLLLNGKYYSQSYLKSCSAFVQQEDLLNPSLTALETITYAAELRCNYKMTREQKQEKVRSILEQVGLWHVRDVIVGNSLKKGLSGGQKKRLTLAIGLLTDPALLFLDEPSSGLSSSDALQIVTLLRDLSRRGTTIICSIHQPQSKIFLMFDAVIFCKAGSIMYQGSISRALKTFEDLGYPCKPFTNPADHLIDVISGTNLSEEEMSELEEALLNKQRQHSEKIHFQVKKALDANAHAPHNRVDPDFVPTPWMHQFKVLLDRAIKEQLRLKTNIAVSLLLSVVMAVLIGTAFLLIGTGVPSIVRRGPVLFFCAVNQGAFGALMVINSFPSERLIILRERASGMYNVSAYFVAKNVAEILIQTINPIVFSCIVYFLIGLQPVASKFFLFMLFMILSSLAATSAALLISCVARTTDLSVIILPMMLEISRLFGGFFLSPNNLPLYFSWLDALSYVKYGYIGSFKVELDGLQVSCQGQSGCETPEATIARLGLDFITVGGCIGALFAYIIGCRLLAFVGIRFIKW